MRKPRKDITGKRFSRLVVIKPDENSKKFKWICKCDCGNMSSVEAYNLNKGLTKSCGCLHRESITTHGMDGTKAYKAWISLKSRCYNKNDKDYKSYGGRGIKVCDKWLSSFEEFYNDIGEPPSSKMSIDRIDNTKGYQKDNCRWVDIFAQNRNRRTSKIWTIKGHEFDSSYEAAKFFNVGATTILRWCNPENTKKADCNWRYRYAQ